MGYSPIVTLEQTGSVHGSRGMRKMAHCSIVSHPDRVALKCFKCDSILNCVAMCEFFQRLTEVII